MVMGTAAYMSPEQARGRPVDRRADIWAFGVVLYEMLTGTRAFAAEDVSLTLAEVMKSEPDWEALPDDVSPALRVFLQRCLRKDPSERVRDIGDVRLALSGAFDVVAKPAAGATEDKPGARLRWVAAIALAATVTGLGAWQLKPAAPQPVVHLAHDLSTPQESLTPSSANLAFSPDGRRLAYSTMGAPNSGISIRNMDDLSARPLLTTDGFHSPRFSPDGEWIVFVDRNERKVQRVPTAGGTPVTVADLNGLSGFAGMDWGDDGTILYSVDRGIFRVPATGGTPEPVSDSTLADPRLLPGGDAVLGVLWSVGPNASGRIAVLSLGSGAVTELFEGDRAEYAETGHVVFSRGNELLAAPFDASRLESTGGATTLVEGLGTAASSIPQFAISKSGSLAYLQDGGEDQRLRVLALSDPNGNDGKVEALDVPAAEYSNPRFSPDGSRLVVQSPGDDGNRVLWIYDLSGQRALHQLTFEGDNSRAVWNPDGRRIAFASDRGSGSTSIYWKPADGSGGAERLTTAPDGVDHLPSSWSPDGEALAFMVHRRGDADWDVWVRTSDAETNPLFDDPDRLHMAPEFSPNGKWIAYHSGESIGTQHVYVEPFPPTGAKHRVSPDRAFFPMWSPEGAALFFRPVSGQRVMTMRKVEISLTPDFGFSYERTLSLPRFVAVSTQRDYDISPDGAKILLVLPSGGSTEALPQRLHIVTNWFEELRARVPSQ